MSSELAGVLAMAQESLQLGVGLAEDRLHSLRRTCSPEGLPYKFAERDLARAIQALTLVSDYRQRLHAEPSLSQVCMECMTARGSSIPRGRQVTWHVATCDLCQVDRPVTEPRNFRPGWVDMEKQDGKATQGS